MYIFPQGGTDVTIYVRLRDSSTGLAKTGLAYNSDGASCYYTRPRGAATQITLATQTVTGAHTDGGFVEVNATNAKGLYRLDLPDAVCASGENFALVSIEFDGIIEETILIVLTPMPSQVTGKVVSDAGNSTTQFKTDLASSQDNFYRGAFFDFRTGQNGGAAARKCTAYNGTTKIVTVDSSNPLPFTPAADDEFAVLG